MKLYCLSIGLCIFLVVTCTRGEELKSNADIKPIAPLDASPKQSEHKDLPINVEDVSHPEGSKDDIENEDQTKNGQATDSETEDNDQELVVEGSNDEALQKPGMQRLARYLHNFHEQQEFLRHSPPRQLGRNANSVSKDDDDIVAEERAVRRRKRIRRRNTKNKVKRTHRNRLVANRKNSSRRRMSNNKSTKRKNVKRVKSKRRNHRRNTNTRRRVNRNSGVRRRRVGVQRRSQNDNKNNRIRNKKKNRKPNRKKTRKQSPNKGDEGETNGSSSHKGENDAVVQQAELQQQTH